jgi:outer membrane protein OmpA-like peptidoglycan-associated protein
VLGAVAVMLAGVAGVSTAVAPAASADEALPVVGSQPVTLGDGAVGTTGTVTLNAVRRIPGGTAVYYSLSSAPGGGDKANIYSFASTSLGLSYLTHTGRVLALDGTNAYGPLKVTRPGAGSGPLSTRYFTAGNFGPNAFYTAYAVLPSLPAERTTADILIGDGAYFPAVPIGTGALEPTTDGRTPVPLGGPWPAIDPQQVATADASGSVFPLVRATADLENTITSSQTDKTGSVDLSADVLFAVDQATLTPAARAKIQSAAQLVNSKAAPGAVTIVGHTDSTGTPAPNLDLSRRRAAAVAAVLQPLVTVAGVTFTVDGKGETQPVASNETPQGRQANRRVSVGFTVKGA